MAAPVVRIDAIKYARHERTALSNFARPVDDHDLPMPLDYFVWAIHRDGHPPVIVDTGFGEEAAMARGRTLTRPVNDGLRAAGVRVVVVPDCGHNLMIDNPDGFATAAAAALAA